jgi:alpha-tubulin suppressor-like RCC1 family protein
MIPIACTLIRRLAPVIVPALVVAALGCREDAESPTAPEATPSHAASATHALAFSQVSAGGSFHNCGVTTDNRAYCWGGNYFGPLGDGTTTDRLTPVAVLGGLRFRQVSMGTVHSCGVTTDNLAYCWGYNGDGQLGDGTTTNRLTPVALASGLRFRQVSAGWAHTCGLSYPDNRAYCWGSNFAGRLGDGTTTDRLTPVAVLGGLQFRQVSAGGDHTCGLTTANAAYCWGFNRYGQLGDSTEVGRRLQPRLVAGARRFRQVDAGTFHTCAVTIANRALCWGRGREGQIGDGKTYLRFWPRAVAGELLFERVSAGEYHTCGETTLNRAYCWGYNSHGEIGDGTTTIRLTPVAVAGGLYFSQVSAGRDHGTCGRTPAAVLYCWGANFYGRIGDGTTTDRHTPTPVAGTM